MDEVVTIECRGMSATLSAGDALVVESCEAGVLRLRRAPPAQPVAVHLTVETEKVRDTDV